MTVHPPPTPSSQPRAVGRQHGRWRFLLPPFRLREVVERQQMVVAKLVETVSNKNTVRLEKNSSSTVEQDSETLAPAAVSQHETLLARKP